MHLLISLVVIAALPEIAITSEEIMEYWVELELLAVRWKPACLTTGGCANPRFKISKSSKFSAEIISVSWSITENFVEVGQIFNSFPYCAYSHFIGGNLKSSGHRVPVSDPQVGPPLRDAEQCS